MSDTQMNDTQKMSNIQRSRQILKVLAERGVREIVLCAGARNAPFVSVLSKAKGFRIYSFLKSARPPFSPWGVCKSRRDPWLF